MPCAIETHHFVSSDLSTGKHFSDSQSSSSTITPPENFDTPILAEPKTSSSASSVPPGIFERLGDWSSEDCSPEADSSLSPKPEESRCERLKLVLDLDETLLHTETSFFPEAFRGHPHLSFSFALSGLHYFVFLRPHVKSFLKRVSKYYDVYIYSNGTHAYVTTAISHLFKGCGDEDEQARTISGIFARTDDAPPLAKNLMRCRTDPSQTIIIDDRVDVWRSEDFSNVFRIAMFHPMFPGMGAGMFTQDTALKRAARMLVSIHRSYKLGTPITASDCADVSITRDVREVLKDHAHLGHAECPDMESEGEEEESSSSGLLADVAPSSVDSLDSCDSGEGMEEDRTEETDD